MRGLIIYACLIVVAGVIYLFTLTSQATSDVNVDPNQLGYLKDTRTNLCFVVIGARSSSILGAVGLGKSTGVGITNVPCSDQVEALIE